MLSDKHRTFLANEKLEELRAENQRLRDEIAGFPNLAAMRQAMIDTANENQRLMERLRESTDQLQCVLESGENIARHDIVRQIAANEAALESK